MTGHELMPNGMIARDYIYGWDLPGGFDSFEEALSTCDECLQWGSLWKVRGKIYELIPVFGNKPFFSIYEP